MNIKTADEIGIFIREERKKQGILQQDLAELSRVSIHFLSNLENGRQSAEMRKVFAVLRSLGISMHLETRAQA